MRGAGGTCKGILKARHQDYLRRRKYGSVELVPAIGYQESAGGCVFGPIWRERGVEAIEALADTRAVDLWILFPYGAINRMLVSDALPLKA